MPSLPSLNRLIGRQPPARAPYLPDGYEPLPYATYMARRPRWLMGDLDPATARGLEIGVLNAPVVTKGEGDVRYVDYATADVLRERYRGSDVDPATILDVDLVWDERPLKEHLGDGEAVDYVLAVHMIEHAPDLVGWLLDMRGVLKAGGLLGLIVPDRRHTFDLYRRESTLAEALEAYLGRYRKPSVRQVFDHFSHACTMDTGRSWEEPAEATAPVFQAAPDPVAKARAVVEDMVRTGAYVDSHCWVFTPLHFVDLARALAGLGLFPFTVEFIQPTVLGWNEFVLRLRAAEPGDPAVLDSLAQARRAVLDDPNEAIYAERMRRAGG
jgi:SAM-dependent methyltransferase